MAALLGVVLWPLWWPSYLPFQDLPQHLAAIRVLHSYDDARLALEPYFTIDLLRTQYLTYYVAADLLAYPFGVATANRLLITAFVCGTPLAMHRLLAALGHEPRRAWLLLPLTYNAHLILGFFNFLAAIPLALYGLTLAVRQRRAPTRKRAWALAALTVITFYTHVVPFGLLGLGAAAVSVGDDIRHTLRRWLPLLPGGVAAIAWSLYSPAGRATRSAAGLAQADAADPLPKMTPWLQAWQQAPRWLTDVFHGHTDDRVLVTWMVLLLGVLGAGVGRRITREDASGAQLIHRIAWLSPFAAACYFLLPDSYDWIWPIAPRFPLLACIFALLLLPRLPRRGEAAVAAAAAALTLVHVAAANEAFEGFQDEVGRLDAAIEQIPPGERVAGLIWARGSREVKFSPFIHSVAYYQARKGGAVMFTFADFPQSPFQFRPDHRPPPVPPRWEWQPEHVDPARDLAWYRYVLVRGGPGRIAQQPDRYETIFRSRRWSVWKRRP